MNRKRLLIPLLLIAVVAATAYSMGWFHHDAGLQGSGTVEARDIRVGSKIGGRIDKVLVREGDSVSQGQVLITFDDKELLASLDQSRANAEEIRADLDFQRYDALAQKDLVSKQQRDTAEANWKMAVAVKDNAQHKLAELK